MKELIQHNDNDYYVRDAQGNVLATVSDKRRGIDPGHTGNITAYVPGPVALYDYYPFGMLMPGRYVYDTANHCELVTETAPVLTTGTLGWSTLGVWCRPCGFTSVGSGIITFGGSSMMASSTTMGDGASLDVSTVSGTPYSGSVTVSGLTGGSWTLQAIDITSSSILAATTVAQQQTAALNFTATGPSTRISMTAGSASSTITVTAIPLNFTTWTSGTIVTTVCSKDGDAYRYGFNGQLKDNEWAGVGNHYEYGARNYDVRIGRPISLDPLTKKYPWYTPYQFAGNSPIEYVDIDGKEEGLPTFLNDIRKTAGAVVQTYNAVKVVAAVAAHVAVATNKAERKIEEHTTPAQRQAGVLTIQFLLGIGPKDRYFGPDEPITQDLKQSKLTGSARAEFYLQNKAALEKGDFASVRPLNKSMNFGLTGLTREGGNAQQFVGSAYYHISLSDDHKKLNFTIYNETSEKSLLYHLPVDNHTRSVTPFLGTTSQTYEFSEPLQEPTPLKQAIGGQIVSPNVQHSDQNAK